MVVVMYDGLKSPSLTLSTLTLTLTMGAQLRFIGVAPQSVTILGVPSWHYVQSTKVVKMQREQGHSDEYLSGMN